MRIYFVLWRTKSDTIWSMRNSRILFGTRNYEASKFKMKKVRKLNIKYGNIQIKQHSKVKYLGCKLDETMSGETMALSVINKINNKLKFLYRKNRFLTPTLRRLLCNALL